MQSPPLSISITLSSCQTETLYPLNENSLCSPAPGPWQHTILLFVFMILTTLRTSYTWNHTAFAFLWLAISLNTVHRVHLCYSTLQNSLPFKGWVIFHSVYIPHLSTHSSILGHLGCSHILAIMNNAVMNMNIQLPLWEPPFNSFGHGTQKRNWWIT